MARWERILKSPSAPPRAPRAELPAVPGYEVLGELGRGGMGVVYKARQTKLNRLVALKVMRARGPAESEELDRFRAEAEAAARLQHPHIVQVYDVGQQDGWPYLTLELVEGGSLAEKLDGAPQPARPAARLLEVLAGAVHFAHQRHVVHRDLKPANVLLTADGTPKVTDFGLAKILEEGAGLTRTGVILGTPSYMAPEQAGGKSGGAGPAADVYALGAILYQLLTGRPPFRGETAEDTLHQVRTAEPVPPRRLQPKVPRDLETICLKCLQKEPPRRYASAAELAEELQRFTSDRPIRARPTPAWERALRWARRRPAVAALLSVSGLAAVVLLVTLAVSNVLIGQEKRRAEENYRTAETNRRTAETNRRRALEAVHRYYTEVSEDMLLREPGLQPLRSRLLQNARQFYQEFVDERRDDPDAQVELARALRRLASITNEIDLDKRKAIELLEEARRIQEPLARANEGNAPLQSELGKTLHGLGSLCYYTGDTDAAAVAYRQAQDLQEALVQKNAGVAEYQDDLTRTYQSVGNLYIRLGQKDQAAAALRQALTRGQQLVDEYADVPRYKTNLAHIYSVFGSLYEGRDWDKCENAKKEARKLFAELAAADPRITYYQHHLADALQDLGICNHARNKNVARDFYLESLKIRAKLADENSKVIDYQKGLARTHNSAALLYSELRQWDEAKKHFEAALKVQDRWGPETQDIGFRSDWAATYNNLGLLYQRTNQRDQARQSFQQAITILKGLDLEKQALPGIAVSLGGVYGNMGTLLRDSQRLEEAMGWYDRAIQTLEAVRAKRASAHPLGLVLRNAYLGRALTRAYANDPAGAVADAAEVEKEPNEGAPPPGDILYDLACVYALCSTGRPQHAAYAVALLERARSAGYFNGAAQVEQLKGGDPDLKLLQSREDFQKLRRSLEGQK
jgi:serine/threonine protein kinase/tetratricopeptide (TPR) repeat protein